MSIYAINKYYIIHFYSYIERRFIILFSLRDPTFTDLARKISECVILRMYFRKMQKVEIRKRRHSFKQKCLKRDTTRHVPLCEIVLCLLLSPVAYCNAKINILRIKNLFMRKTMLRTHPSLATREQHADLTCVCVQKSSLRCFVPRCLRLLFNSPGRYHVRLYREYKGTKSFVPRDICTRQHFTQNCRYICTPRTC